MVQVFTIACVNIFSAFAADTAKEGHLIGGPCEYKTYEGRAKIISINARTYPGDPSDETYEVKFAFYPDQKIIEPYVQTEDKEYLLLLTNSSYPGKIFLLKYGIEIGKVFACNLRVITKGTCSPVIFEFPSINLDDYNVKE
jgi:hypothetical protein